MILNMRLCYRSPRKTYFIHRSMTWHCVTGRSGRPTSSTDQWHDIVLQVNAPLCYRSLRKTYFIHRSMTWHCVTGRPGRPTSSTDQWHDIVLQVAPEDLLHPQINDMTLCYRSPRKTYFIHRSRRWRPERCCSTCTVASCWTSLRAMMRMVRRLTRGFWMRRWNTWRNYTARPAGGYKVWAFSFSPRHPSSLSCINEYLALDSGGNASDLVFVHNCCVARRFPREVGLVSEWTGLSGGEV